MKINIKEVVHNAVPHTLSALSSLSQEEHPGAKQPTQGEQKDQKDRKTHRLTAKWRNGKRMK